MESKKKKYFTVSASSLTTMQSCEYKYYLSHMNRLVPIRLEEALDYGGLVHFMLNPFYFHTIREVKEHHEKNPLFPIRSLSKKSAIEACIEMGKLKALQTDLHPDDRARAVDLFINYTEFWLNDGWVAKEVEQPFSVVIYEDDDLAILYVGKVDLIVDIPQEGEVVTDHKTGGRDNHIPETNNQIVGSCFAFKKNKFLINKALAAKENPFRRYPYFVSTEQKQEWLLDTIHYVKRMIHYMGEDYFPMNRSSCGSFGSCRYLTLCKCPASARDIKIEGLFKRSNHVSLYEEDPVAKIIYNQVLKGNHAELESHA